jgi:hypothetical protein
MVACNKDKAPCFTSVGDVITQQRTVPAFNQIVVGQMIHVRVFYSPQQRVVVNAGENIADWVTTAVDSGKLKINDENRCVALRSFKQVPRVDVYTPTLSGIKYTGGGNITFFDTLDVDTFYMHSVGAGDIRLLMRANRVTLHVFGGPADVTAHGRCNNLSLYSNGLGPMRLRGMKSLNTFITHDGTNDIEAGSSGYLEVFLHGIGNVFWSGLPGLTLFEDSGDGDIIYVP